MSMQGNIAKKWKELQGIQDNWAALLNAPDLDIDLRRSILVYGNLVAAVGDSLSKKEPRGCLYDLPSLFSEVGLEKGNIYQYQPTKFIYTTTPVLCDLSSRYAAYVAVATDKGKAALGRRDIVVAWSDTKTHAEEITDLDLLLVDPRPVLGNNVVGKVHGGFLSVYTTANENSPFEYKTSAKDQVMEEVKRLVDLYQDESDVSITLVGISLGSALATLCSIDIVANKYNRPSNNPEKQIPVTVITFGSPRVGDCAFAEGYSAARGGGNLNLLRVTNLGDPVPNLPPGLFYKHCGVKIMISAKRSPYIKPAPINLAVHDIEVYCHGVAGSHIHDENDEKEFFRVIDRPVALLNKVWDLLNNSEVPEKWWIQEPRGMVQSDDGTWHIP